MAEENFHVSIKRAAFDFLSSLKNSDVVILLEQLGRLHPEAADFSGVRADGRIVYSKLLADFVVDYYVDSSNREIRVENVGYADDPHDVDDSI